eukprot:CAMPEP_0117069262 /NCGR_PEP_ID=MMETSP0472-20121206/48571_1 /TAXON_ID=693140 ORGANISM="Tiarina fusus, Strain LIS" /NCGR_SAMPLE_ID=MMETSP0472 /ASSEMBLY_ACC=CAM_ASM_000603 /LENGTH=240 /DNA_ID=CAMNT_0004791713 /DNA_START=60 /DNA_END=782 /DNA_ORIENTATION=+
MTGENTEDLQPYETEPDSKGIKLVVSYRTDDDGVKYKVTKKVLVTKKITRVPKGVADRQNNWVKFGEVAKIPNGVVEPGVTYEGDDVYFEPTEVKEEDEKVEEKTEIAAISCRHCGGPHWSHRCVRHVADTPAEPAARPGRGAYEPPNRRGNRTNDPEKAITTLRISNLSEDCTDDDLRNTFSRFGYITRIYLARDRQTNIPKGFAYVTFELRSDAEKAKENTVGVGLDHLIWSIEWARS